MDVTELVTIVDGAFDAGLILNENGSILHGNRAAQDLLSDEASAVEAELKGGIDSHLSGWGIPGGTQFQGAESFMQWKDVLNLVVLMKGRGVAAWRAIGKKGTSEFVARVKITVLPTRERTGDSRAILFVRPDRPSSATRVATADNTGSSNEQKVASPSPPRSCPVADIVLQDEEEGYSMKDSDSIEKSSFTSHQQLTSLMSAMAETCLDPMFQINEKGIIIMVNKSAMRQFGWSREEFLGSNISMIAGDERGKHHDSYIQRYLETGETKVIGKRRELKARRKDGSEFPIELAVTEVETFEGDDRLFCGFVRDLTDIKRKQSISTGIIEASLDPILVIDATNGLIKMSNAAATRQFGWSEEEFLGRDIRSLAQLDDVHVFFPEHGGSMETELLVRRKNGTVFPAQLGIVEIDRFGDQHLLCETFHDLTSLRREESFKAGAMEASLDPMFQINDEGIIQLVNNAATILFGWSKEEFLGSNISMIAGGAHRKYHDDYIRRYLQTGIAKVIGKTRELPARRKDGSEIQIELGVTEINTDFGGQHLFCGYVHDVTRIKKNERLFAGIIEASLDPMFQINEGGTIQLVNNAAVRLFGWTQQEFMGSNISMIVGGGHAKNHDHYIRRYLKTSVTRVIGKKRELIARRKDGSEFPIELGVSEIKTGTREERLFCGFVRDVSEMKKVESLSNGIFESSLNPMFQVDVDGTIRMANTVATQMFDWHRDELVGMNICMIVKTGKESNYLQQYLKAGEKGRKWEAQVLRRDGSVFPAEISVVQVMNDLAEERHFTVVIRDLSEQVEREQELRRSEALANSIVRKSLTAVLVTDTTGLIKCANEAAATLFMWSIEQLCRGTIEMLFPPEDTAILLEELVSFSGVSDPPAVPRECEAMKSDDSRFPAVAAVRKIDAMHGSTLFAIFVEDSTERDKTMKPKIQQIVAGALVLNVLPRQMLRRLRNGDSRIVQSHSSATVLFSEIHGTRSKWSDMDPAIALTGLNELSALFDNIVNSHDLTRWRAAGGCYIVADVLGDDNEESGCSRICHLALDMMEAVAKYRDNCPGHDFNLCIGIHTGPVMAGVTKSMYDIFGEAVFVASQVARSSTEGEIKVTREVVDSMGNSLSFDPTGTLKVTGTRDVESFLLLSRLRKVRQMRRPSFYKQLSRLKSFLLDGPSVDAFGDTSWRMDLYQALHALELLPPSSSSDDESEVDDWNSDDNGDLGYKTNASSSESKEG